MISRKTLLRAIGAGGLLSVAPLDRIFRLVALAAGAESQEGEVYGGFLLLSSDAPLPATVRYPAQGMPSLCGLGGQTPTALIQHFATHGGLRDAVRFPLYELNGLSDGGAPAGAYTIEYDTGNIFAAAWDYRVGGTDPDSSRSVATLWGQPEHPHPLPFWAEPAYPQVNVPEAWPEKVAYLPSPGLKVPSRFGYDFYWIAKDVFYQLSLKNGPSADEAQRLASSLRLVA